ncbi:MAG: hypothetical protein Q8O13_10685 [Candidatus Omnitrophota bacterium]|nr:hypothetical protein [Candidatus Omnitrophota bacterium]
MSRAGIGVGGGVSYDPWGSAPGWNPCKPRHAFGVGGFGQAGVGIGPLYGGIDANLGIYHTIPYDYETHFYRGFSPKFKVKIKRGWKFTFGLAIGGQTFVY